MNTPDEYTPSTPVIVTQSEPPVFLARGVNETYAESKSKPLAARPRLRSGGPLLVTVLAFVVLLLLLPSLVAPVVYAINRAKERAKADVAREVLRDFPDTVQRTPWVIKKVAPSVVGIETFADGQRVGEGSGVIIDADGHVLTNFHVLAMAERVVVQLLDGRRISDVQIVGFDRVMDLAVLKVVASELAPIDWGDSSAMEVGDPVVAIGNPFGFSHTATTGIVSAKERYSASPSSSRVQEYLQIDAAINPGNSGGPLVNQSGDLVGINTMIAGASESFSGIGLAIPSNLARQVYERLRRDGEIVHGWLGIGLEPVSLPLSQHLGWEKPTGAIVTFVAPWSPAAEAGLEPGDIIQKWDNTPVASHLQLSHTVIITPPETRVVLTILRHEEATEIPVTIGRRPAMK
ncbi:MAG: S1C family serine protease [Thermoguttaceae bacterium]